MAKSIKSRRKNKDNNGYSFMVSASLNKKKLIKNIEKSVLSSLNKKDSFVPLSNLTVTVDNIKKTTPNYWKIATIILLLVMIFGLVFVFKFYSYKNLSPVSKQPTLEIITVTPTSTPTPKIINHKINILILNASRLRGIASNLKKSLIQNKFENITIGNNKKMTDSVLIEYKPGCEFEAKYLKDNYLGLSNAILSQINNPSSSVDINIILGKSYISK